MLTIARESIWRTEHGPFGTDSNIGLGLALGYSLGVRASFGFASLGCCKVDLPAG